MTQIYTRLSPIQFEAYRLMVREYDPAKNYHDEDEEAEDLKAKGDNLSFMDPVGPRAAPSPPVVVLRP